jgi:choice-of-anchor A domain-containing protein
VSTESDIVGDAVVVGNSNGATVFGGGGNVPTSPVLSVYGSLTNTNGLNINAGGDLFYNGVISTPSHHVSGAPQVNVNAGGSQQPLDTATNPITNFTSPLTALSQQLAGLQATSGATISHGDFNAGSNTGIVVFDVTGQQLEADLGSNITFTGAGVTSYIINVTGDFSEPNGDNWNTLQPDALFNFSNASTVAVGNWGASILAPDAALSILNGNISGSVFAANFSGGGELHTTTYSTERFPLGSCRRRRSPSRRPGR